MTLNGVFLLALTCFPFLPSTLNAPTATCFNPLASEDFSKNESFDFREDVGPTILSEFGSHRQPTSVNIEESDFLADPASRISEDFKVPEGMRERTAFWFDVYTKYGSTQHVIHHARYPWIVFSIVDTSDILNSGKGHKWTRYHKAEALVKSERQKVARTLKKLARRTSFKKLTPFEKQLFDSLASLKGRRQAVLRFAAENVRTQLGQKDFFISGLVNSRKYLHRMEEVFSSMGLPVELTRMPFVESSFNENAESKVGASGIWQIMPRTGKAYLIVNDHIDERNSPLKATEAAARLLSRYYKHFQSWPLAVTAYNHGIGSLQKAIKAVKSKDLQKIIAKYHRGSFKFASSNFYASFLAALHAEKYHQEIFKNSLPPLMEPVSQEIVQLARGIRVRKLCQLLEIDVQELISYNLDLKSARKKNILLPRGFELHLPTAKKHLFERRLADYHQPVKTGT